MNELGREPRPPTSFTFQPRGHSPPPSREPAPDHHSPWASWKASPETDLPLEEGCALASVSIWGQVANTPTLSPQARPVGYHWRASLSSRGIPILGTFAAFNPA